MECHAYRYIYFLSFVYFFVKSGVYFGIQIKVKFGMSFVHLVEGTAS